MTKYQKMAQDPYFVDWVSYIKALQGDKQKLLERADSLPNYDSEYASLLNDAQDAECELRRAEWELYDLIKREYELVPFVQSRNQGISGFYREVGLKRPS